MKTPYLDNAVADIHNHPPGSAGPPSAADVWGAMEMNQYCPDLQGRYIMAPNGEFYCVAITDKAKARAFVSRNNQDDVVNSGDNMFNQDSDFGKDFEAEFRQFKDLGHDNAWCHAMSAVADKHGMGITIMKAEKGSRQFKSKHVKKGSDGSYRAAECL